MTARAPYEGALHRRELPQSWDADDWLLGLTRRAELEVVYTEAGTRVRVTEAAA